MIILIIHIIVSYDQNISLIFLWKMDPMSSFDIRLVFTLAPRDSTLQYKRCVHFWNNFPCLTSLSWSNSRYSLCLTPELNSFRVHGDRSLWNFQGKQADCNFCLQVLKNISFLFVFVKRDKQNLKKYYEHWIYFLQDGSRIRIRIKIKCILNTVQNLLVYLVSTSVSVLLVRCRSSTSWLTSLSLAASCIQLS